MATPKRRKNKWPSVGFIGPDGDQYWAHNEALSPAYRAFYAVSLKDVNALIATYNQCCPSGKGRRHLGHLTRSAVLMLCAAWEQYIEESLKYFLETYLGTSKNPEDMPKEIQKFLCKYIHKKSENELRYLDLSGLRWKQELLDAYAKEVESLNTPKTTNIDMLYEKIAGIQSLSTRLKKPDQIDAFVKLRGEIAHSGSRATYVKFQDLSKYRDLVVENVTLIEQILHQLIFERRPTIMKEIAAMIAIREEKAKKKSRAKNLA